MENKAGRGLPFNYNLTYDTSVWYPVTSNGTTTWQPVTNWGWSTWTAAQTGYVYYNQNTNYCYYYTGYTYVWIPYEVIFSNFIYYDSGGTPHPFPGANYIWANPGCGCPSGTTSYDNPAVATDGSGYVWNGKNWTLTNHKGETITPPYQAATGAGSTSDANGNTISNSSNGVYTDTLGVTALSVSGSGTPSSPVTFQYAGGGGPATLTVIYTALTVQTAFGCGSISEFGPTAENLVNEIDLPDDNPNGTRDRYVFTYEQTPGNSANVTGRLASVTLPTGGTISYTYSGGANGITCNSGSSDGTAATLTRTTPDGTWTYAHTESTTAWTTDITAPADAQGNQAYTVMNFQGIYPTEQQVYATNGGPQLLDVTTCYGGPVSSCTRGYWNTLLVVPPITDRIVLTTPYTNNSPGSPAAVMQLFSNYASHSLPYEIDEYDWGPTLSRKTITAYDYNTSCGVTNSIVVDKPCSVTVENSSGGTVASTSCTYDANGNLLTEAHTNTGGSPSSISRSFSYGSYGVLHTATDFNGNTTTFSNTYCGNAFPASITSPISSLAVSLEWNCNGAVPTQVTDPNGQTTTYSYDNFWRLVGTGYPDGGQTTVTYTDSEGAFSVATSRLVSGALGSHTVTQYLDGLGRVINSVDTQACSEVETAYDGLGRVYSVSNPYCSTSSGVTKYAYDALSRPTSISYPDTASASISYSGNCSTATDPAGKKRELCSDGLGRLTSVTEDPGNLGYQTSYTYDALNDLTGVTQGGQTRTYSYDMLARLTSAKVPEVNVSGTRCSTSYGHDANGNVTSRKAPKENQNSSCSSTVTTTYAYDALNRLTSKTYSDGTPTASFSYDQASVTIGSWSSGTLTNPKGRMTEATTTASGSVKTGVVYSYDPVGRISDFWQCNPGNCGTSSIYAMAYGHDEAGDVTSWSHPGLINFNNTVNAAQQITGVTTTSSYTNLPQTLVQSVTYTPFGAVSQFENGCAGSGCLNAYETYTYNNRLQPWMIQLGTASSGSGAHSDYCLVYNYFSSWTPPSSCPSPGSVPTSGSGNNGSVMGYWYQDSVNSSFSHTASYTYDDVSRLITAVATGNSTYNLTFGYDAYGNMTCQTNAQTNGPCPNWAYNASTNQLSTSGFTYDAAGDLTTDKSNATTHTYQWDADGRVSTVDSGATWSFTYNALGQRVQMVSSGGTQELMYDPYGNWLGIYGVLDVLPWGGGAFAWYNGTETYFNHINNLSSTSMMTNHAGTAVEDIVFYPWGQSNWLYSGGGGYQFADTPYYDPATNTTLALFRNYSPGLGRWLSPDPSGMAAVSLANPQTWNMYAHVTNNPTTLTDPLGLDSSGWVPCYEYYCSPPCDGEGEPSCISAYGMGGLLPQFEANYAGDAPFSSAANSPLATTMAAANAFVTNVTGFVMNAVPIPGAGEPGYQGGGEFDIGFKWFVDQTMNDLLESYLASFAAGTLANPSSFPSDVLGLKHWLDAEEDLQDWLKDSPFIPTLSPPSTACFASYAAYMDKLGKIALAYYQTQKQPPPLSMTIPPPIQCN